MGNGKFTLYRGTHGKAILWFAGILMVGLMMTMLWKHLDDPCTCVAAPQVLGRFVITPEEARFVRSSPELAIVANRQVVKCG